jgi:hypothetical protein
MSYLAIWTIVMGNNMIKYTENLEMLKYSVKFSVLN